MFSGTIDPIDLDIQAIIAEDLSPRARSAALAEAARAELKAAEDTNAAALGYVPRHSTVVDGAAGADESQVRPDGEIVYSFDLGRSIFGWIAGELASFAPVLTGQYLHSFLFFVDGVLTALDGEIPDGHEYVFMSAVPYAGKIEGEHRAPESEQAPNGVFEAVATLAQLAFPGADIGFSYRAPFAGAAARTDTPAITVRLGQ
ncbi:hypothetical protein [Bradyrhizobium sp. SZCCHNR1020]|uniref:hypothetical protein n=1 Tax=Bradyrhizobium sp. SZCCHNR1020 TaxID=3057343 RepID=UPI002915C9CA|nr:hypothetical protein [Bradyrhizobium sp. SZCCHNR1020]